MGLITICWALLFLLVEHGWCNSTNCPFNDHCNCTKAASYHEYSEINCKRLPFSRLSGFPDVRIEKLEVTESGIDSLDEDSFGGLTAYTVVLDGNRIATISNNTFKKMGTTLKELSLNNNDLNEIPMNALLPLETLKSLKIEGNKISSVIVNWMNLKDSLTELRLSNNDIDSIPLNPEHSLSNFKRLSDIYLSGNLLQSLEANSLPYSLKLLNASNNYIKNFPNDLLNILQELSVLDLSENNIEDLREHNFRTRINLDIVNLSYNRLKVIKKSFGDTIKINKLDLSINNITDIEKAVFSGLECKEINLSSNKLSKLEDSSVKGLESSLEHLDLSYNKFTKVPSGIKDLKKLKSLNLAHNHMSKVKNSLYYLSELKKLSLSGNELGVFPVEALGPLRSLTSLDLSYNKIGDVRKSDFKTWGKYLESLNLQSNSLFFLGDNVFEYTPKLTKLSLSYNTIGDMSLNAFKNLDNIDRLEISFGLKGYGFPTPILSLKSLSYLAIDNNNVNAIPKDITKLDRLKTLILDFNRIKEIELSTFDSKAHKFLTDIRLSFNFINKIDSNTFSELNSLEFISLHDNKIMKISEYSFINLPENLSIYLSGNKIDNIEKHSFSSLPRLKLLDLHRNNLQRFDYNIFQNVTSISEPLALNLSWNRIDTLTVPDYERAPVHVRILDLDHNKITDIPEKIVEIQPSLKVLRLGFNEITNLSSQGFYSMINLESLSLIHNKIRTIKEDTFVSLKKLHMLNLSHNHIEEIPAGLFKSLESLRILDLSSNIISIISLSAFDNTKLDQLYLSNNKISSISPSAFLNIGKTLRVLELSHNQIVSFDNKFFQYASKIESLNLCHNNLTSDNLEAFRNSSSLLKLDLCGNYLTKIPELLFSNASLLYELNLAGTSLENFPNLTLPNLLTLRLSDNKIKNLSATFVSGLPKLKVLDLKNNEISALNGINWIQTPSLRNLDLSHNPIKVLDKPCFFGLYNLRELNIQYLKQIDHLDSGIFMDLDKVTSLKIDFQRKVGLNLNQTLAHLKYLRALSLNVMDSKFMEDLPNSLPWKLRTLEIIGKDLTYIDPEVLKSIKSFHKFNLHITNTGISHFPKHFFYPYKAKQFTIDISNNELDKVGPEIFYYTNGDIRRYGTKAFTGGVDVHGNKLPCGCEIKWYAEWLRRYLVETVGVNKISVKERLKLIEGLNELTCFDKKTDQKFPILTYDFTTDEKLCGIVINVPKVTQSAGGCEGRSLSVIVGAVLLLPYYTRKWYSL